MSFSLSTKRRSGEGGIVWPCSGTGLPSAPIKAVFGPRPFLPHVATVGYEYDFHRGVDHDMAFGDLIYSPCHGAIGRFHRTHFGWETDLQLGYWQAQQDGGLSPAAFTRVSSDLVIAGTRGDVGAWPNVAQWKSSDGRVSLDTAFDLFCQLGSATALSAGKLGMALVDEAAGEYLALEWDGTIATSLGEGSGGAVASHGTTLGLSGQTWLRISLDSGTLSWAVSADGKTWNDIDTEAMPAFTAGSSVVFVPMLYWRSTDVNATPIEILVDAFGWDDSNTVGRFGNWFFINRDSDRFLMVHFQDIYVESGDIIEAGQLLGTVGNTGYSRRSGPVLYPHVHTEYADDLGVWYDNDTAINPLAPDVLPRINVSNNVTVTRSTANDPDAVDCWRLRIQVARADEDFDLNSISLTGNLATRTVNWNTRSGLNADHDIPKQSGVYIVPERMDASSTEYEVSIYFSKAVVGSTFSAANVKDTAGTTLWSE